MLTTLFYNASFFFSWWFTYTFWFLQLMHNVFYPTEEFVIPTGTPTNEANAEIETQSPTAETKIRKSSK